MTGIRAHSRQWLIARSERLHGLPNHFKVRSIGRGLFLHHDHELRIGESPHDVLTLGVLVGDAASTPAAKRHLHSGRFVTITDGDLRLDATGSLAVFYAEEPDVVVCGSSVALIVSVTGAQTLQRELIWRMVPMNWDPSPSCRAIGFRRVFCDQVLDLESGTVRQARRAIEPVAGEPAAHLANFLMDYMTALPKVGGKIWLPLTGGRDSRTLLAAALASGLEFTAYTNLRGGRSVVDDCFARRLARRYGFRHVSNWPRAQNRAALAAFELHTAGGEGDSGAFEVGKGLYDIFSPDDVSLSGGVFEIARDFYGKRLSGIDFDEPAIAARAIAAAFSTDDASVIEALEQWVAYRHRHPVPGIGMIDVFYLDQRLGAWGSANRQAVDACGITRLTPMNSWDAISLLFAVPPSQRRSGALQEAAMEQLVPGISSAEPFNPRFPVDVPARLGFVFRKMARKLAT